MTLYLSNCWLLVRDGKTTRFGSSTCTHAQSLSSRRLITAHAQVGAILQHNDVVTMEPGLDFLDAAAVHDRGAVYPQKVLGVEPALKPVKLSRISFRSASRRASARLASRPVIVE
jgi:hypothetical protein